MTLLEAYKVIGVKESDTIEIIKKRYRKLARENHPDVSERIDAEEITKRLKRKNLVKPNKKKIHLVKKIIMTTKIININMIKIHMTTIKKVKDYIRCIQMKNMLEQQPKIKNS